MGDSTLPRNVPLRGDPEAWDAIAADRAFAGYAERTRQGLRTDWYNDASEFRRVGRRLPAGRVAALLAAEPLSSSLLISLLPLVEHARLGDCADAVFGVYRNPDSLPRERQYALITLGTVASSAQRDSIKAVLLDGRLGTNELISSALAVIDWMAFNVDDLVKVVQAAGAESAYGTGPMARAIKEDLLPAARTDSAQLLLAAVVGALPAPKDGRRFARFPESGQPERAWLLDVLPDCLERVLTLLPTTLERFPRFASTPPNESKRSEIQGLSTETS